MSWDSPVENSDPHLLTHGRKLGRRRKNKNIHFTVTIKTHFLCITIKLHKNKCPHCVCVCAFLTLIGMLRLWFHCGLAFFSKILVQT